VTAETVDHVAAVSMSSGLSERTISRLLSKAAAETVDHHTLLFSQIDRAHCFYIVVQGQVEHYVRGDGGNESVIDVPGPGETFAEEAIFGPGPHRFRASVRHAIFAVMASRFVSRRFFVWHKLSAVLASFVARIGVSKLTGGQI
jgi:CRP-like cAMP-binding protein